MPLDLVPPGRHGIALMAEVPEFSDLPVIFISSYGSHETIALAIDCGRRRVTVYGRAVALTAREYEILRILSVDAGRMVTSESLLRQA